MRLWPSRRADPLGDGVWRRAHDRFRRAVDRYHQVIEPVPDGAVRDRLEQAGTGLAAQLDVVHELCRRAQSQAPSASFEIPGAGGLGSDLHRRLSRSGNLAAQAAESAAMARVAQRSGRDGEAAEHAAAAERSVEAVRSLLRE